jgi:spermidine/putrescine transport system permease protein
VIGPLLIVLAVSFLTRGPYGSVEFPFTLENYKRFLGFGLLGFDPLYPTILLRSVLLGAATAFICAVLALPLAFFIARLPACSKSFALVLVVIPFWTNLLIRTYAWQILLAPDSWLSAAARALGLLGANQGVYPGMAAVLVGMVCDFLPFLVLPLYASVEKIDWQLAEAARDLGAHGCKYFAMRYCPSSNPAWSPVRCWSFFPQRVNLSFLTCWGVRGQRCWVTPSNNSSGKAGTGRSAPLSRPLPC